MKHFGFFAAGSPRYTAWYLGQQHLGTPEGGSPVQRPGNLRQMCQMSEADKRDGEAALSARSCS